jgi:hypothetical protein
MKKIGIICMLILLLGAINVAAQYAENDVAYLHIAETKYEPYPAEPGGYFDLWLNIQNKGRDAMDLNFKLDPDFPFFLDPGEESEKNLGMILSGQTVLVRYKVRVDPNAVEGVNKLRYLFKTTSYEDWNSASVDIMIKTHDIVLAVSSIESIPEKIRPGKVGSINLGLTNMADSLIKDIKVKLDLSEVPLAPIGSTNEKMVQRVDSSEEVTVRFNLMAEPDATSDVYKVPLELDYSDELGNTYQRDTTISVLIGDVPDLTAAVESSTVFQPNKLGEVSIKFVNKGVTDIKFLNIEVKDSTGFTIVSPKEVYVGNIDSDDYETADFKMFVNRGRDELKIPLTLQYMDANNDEYSKAVIVTMPLYSSGEAKKFGLVQASNSTGFFLMVVIVVAGVFGYKKWKKKKAKK